MKVKRKHKTTSHKRGWVLDFEWTFDFDGVPQETILELAVSTLVILARAKLGIKKLPQEKAKEFTNREFRVKELLAVRRPVTPSVEDILKAVESGLLDKQKILNMLK